MDLRFSPHDEAFRAEVRAFLEAELSGPFASVRLRSFGTQPLTDDNSVTQPTSTTLNARVGWRNRDWEFALSLLNALDRRSDDIAYVYTSRLEGEPAAGLDATATAALIASFRRLRRRGLAFVIATRDLAFAQHLATRLVLVEAGSVVETLELQSSRQTHAADSYLGTLVG
jgi:ABC-type branched-subunit amino acid transport system ATPase component